MSLQPFVSEIKIVSFNFPPKGWAFCNGQLLSIAQNQALFALLGTTYGGNGQTTFQLPNLQGRVPLHFGTQSGGPNYVQGQVGGEEAHTLINGEMPQHNHFAQATSAVVSTPTPDATVTWGSQAASNGYKNSNPDGIMAQTALNITGSNQPHTNQMPFLVLNYCIALVGVFPSRN